MHYSKNPSLCNSKFDPQKIGFTRITENEINVGNTQIQDSDQYLFFNSCEMIINHHCSKPITAEMNNFDQNSQILFDDADYDDDINTTFGHLDDSTNHCFLFGNTRNSDVSLIPKVLSNIRDYTSVGNDHCGHPATDANGNDNDDDDGGNGGGGGGGQGGGGGNDDGAHNARGEGGGGRGRGNNDGALLIMKFNREGHLFEYRPTRINPKNYESWSRIAAAVYNIWMDLYSLVGRVAGDTGAVEVHPALCWPGYFPLFGRHEYGRFIALNWYTHDYKAVRHQINNLCLREMNYTELLGLTEFALGPDGSGRNVNEGVYKGNNNGDSGNGGNNNGDSGNGGNNSGDGGNNRR